MSDIISPLPTPPSRNDDPDTFVSRSNAFLAALPDFVTDANNLADTVEGHKDAAAASATAAGNSATAAANSATAAAGAANFQGAWSSLTGAQTKGISVDNDGAIWVLLVDLADVTLSEPGDSNSDWAKVLNITIDGAIAGPVEFSGDVILSGASTISGALAVTGASTISGRISTALEAVTVGGALSADKNTFLIDGGLAVTLPGGTTGQYIDVIGNWADTITAADDAVTVFGGTGDSIQAGADSIEASLEVDSRGVYRLVKISDDMWVLR